MPDSPASKTLLAHTQHLLRRACLLGVGLAAAALAGCGGGGGDPDEAALSRRELLGKRLFFDTALSTPPGQSCASCHDAARAFSGNNGSAAGVALGADGLSLGLRNTPTAMYARFAPAFSMVDEGEGSIPVGGQFLDGRAGSLEDQAGQPFFAPDEMNVASPAVLVGRVAAAEYAELFRQEWGERIFEDTAAAMEAIKGSLAAFERTERFAPFSSKFDHVAAASAAFTAQEQRGLELFMDAGKGNCAACHIADPASRNPAASLFTDFTYDNLGVPRNWRIPANNDPAFFDLGLCGPKRAAPDGDPALCGAFKVPTLRNVERRQALMHNGFFNDLRETVAFYATRDTDPARWYPGGVPFNDLPAEFAANVNRTEAPYDRQPGEAPRLDDAEIDAIVAFLRTLTDGYGPSLAGNAEPMAAAGAAPRKNAARSRTPAATRPAANAAGTGK
ncbi:MAG: c-type cytochrome [Burkholderiales bacterium]|nr:c-type cytochrome [Burkholderiales bacterium]